MSSARAGASGRRGKRDGVEVVLRKLVGFTSVPFVTYVSEPKTILHWIDPRVKQVLVSACVVLAARGSLEVRAGLSLCVLAATLAFLPRHYAKDQLTNLARMCLVVFVLTLLASDSVGLPVQERLPQSAAPVSEWPASLLGASYKEPGYRYVLLDLRLAKVTRRSLRLALAAACLQFTTLQSAAMCLTTTAPERLTWAMGWLLRPLAPLLGRTSRPAEASLSLLLSFRFLGIVFEEAQNVAKGVLSRNLPWRSLAAPGRVDVLATVLSRTAKNLLEASEAIAKSMMARGYGGAEFTFPHLRGAEEGDMPGNRSCMNE